LLSELCVWSDSQLLLPRPETTLPTPSQDVPQAERILRCFEEAWNRQPFPPLDDYLPFNEQDRAAVLLELALVDLRRRWQAGAIVGVEAYLRRYPELAGNHAAVLELIAAECEERQCQGETATVEEYHRRFPHLSEELTPLLERLPPPGGPVPEDSSAPGQSTLQSAVAGNEASGQDTRSHGGVSESQPRTEENDRYRSVLHFLYATEEGSGSDPRREEIDPYGTVAPQTISAPVSPVSAPAVTPVICGYEILGLLGRGGMGVVYKARQIRLKRLVALKMILSGAHALVDQKARFRAEAEAVARLAHPNIVGVYEVGESNGCPFFSLEFVDGGSLEKKLAGKPLPARTAAALVQTLARAMEAAHRCGIVHRDLKPANILLAGGLDAPIEHCTPKITDFGLAKQLDENVAHTQSGAILGTPYYMAPEQAAGRTKEIGPLSDVYALGIILYECLTGRPPFNAATLVEILEQVRHEEPIPPGRLQPRVPRDLETICLKCIEKQPHRRYGSAEALADDLKRFLDDEPILARRVRWWERAGKWARRRPTAAALLGVLLAVGIALPIAGLQFSVQLAKRRQAEEKRLDEARAEVQELLAQGQTASESNDLTRAEGLLDRAMEKIAAEPVLEDLREKVEKARGPVKDQLAARADHKRFVHACDEALFFATLASGDSFLANCKLARERASEALNAVHLTLRGPQSLSLGGSFTSEEKTEITNGCYALLLMLAEIDSRRLPRQSVEEHHEQLRTALKLLDRADQLGVRTRAIHLRRVRYLTALGDGAGAARERERADALAAQVELDSQDHFLVGHELFSQGKLEQATQEFRRALQRNPNHFWTHYFLGICCVSSSKPDVAVAHLTICEGQKKGLIWIYLLRGFALGQLEDYRAAEQDFNLALDMKPSPATLYVLYNNRGVMRVGRKETRAQGVEDLKKAARLSPRQHQAYASLAEAYRLDDKLDEAVKQLDLAVRVAGEQLRSGELKPAALALLYHSRARLNLQRSDRTAAMDDLREAARLAEDNASLRARAEADRGRVLHLEKRFEEALAAYDAAHKANPRYIDVHLWRGEVLLVQHRYREAAAAFDAYLDKGGERSAAVYRQRGLARTKIERHAEAIDDYTRALEANPKEQERASLYLYRGQEYLALNSLPPALRDFTEALRLDPGNPSAALACAHVRIKLDDPHEAVALAEAVVKGEPTDAPLWHGAARIFAQAAAQMKPERGEGRLRSRYQERAVALLLRSVELLPANQRRAYWQEKVMKDPALNAIRSDLVKRDRRLGGRDR
jgi:tetratricopeptide (TPR) repeat protein/tRNA A-37 threonylcarbamoyl transferase component Bud32